jgi:hypothetical protein
MKNIPNSILALLLVGCSDVKSSSIKTNGIFAGISVTVDGTVANVAATLRVGDALSNTYVDLDEGDSLEATNGEETQVLEHTSFIGFHSYTSEFEGTAPDTEYIISFNRASDTSAPNNVVSIPEPLAITVPSGNQAYQLSSQLDIHIEWDSTTSDVVVISIDGDCIGFYLSDEITDAGSHDIPFSAIEPYDDTTGSCTAIITVERRKVGELDAAFGNGRIYSSQKDTVGIDIDP